jgi:hypothetical protein
MRSTHECCLRIIQISNDDLDVKLSVESNSRVTFFEIEFTKSKSERISKCASFVLRLARCIRIFRACPESPSRAVKRMHASPPDASPLLVREDWLYVTMRVVIRWLHAVIACAEARFARGPRLSLY